MDEMEPVRATALTPAMDGAGAMDNLRLPTPPWKVLWPFHTAHSLTISSNALTVLRIRLHRTSYPTWRDTGVGCRDEETVRVYIRNQEKKDQRLEQLLPW